MSTKVKLELQIHFQQREERHIAFLPDIGSFSYGKTAKEAEANVKEALNTLVASFQGDLEKLTRSLANHGIKYTLGEDQKHQPPDNSGNRQTFEFQVG